MSYKRRIQEILTVLEKLKYLIIVFFMLMGCLGQVNAKNYGTVKCGVYPINLYDFNFNNNTFKISFYVWCISQTGYDSGKNFEIANATDYTLNFHDMDKVQNLDRSETRFTATVIKNWDLKYFPFDRQILEVKIEDIIVEEANLKFIADQKNSKIDENFSIPGWTLEKFSITSGTHTYDSNFGDDTISNSKYSQLKFMFNLKRNGMTLFFSSFIGFFVAFLLCILCYFCPVEQLNFRGSLILAATFSTIGNKYIIEQAIPPYSRSLLVDAIQTSTFLLIIYTLIVIIIAHRFVQHAKQAKAIFINNFSATLCTVLYISIVGIVTVLAIVS